MSIIQNNRVITSAKSRMQSKQFDWTRLQSLSLRRRKQQGRSIHLNHQGQLRIDSRPRTMGGSPRNPSVSVLSVSLSLSLSVSYSTEVSMPSSSALRRPSSKEGDTPRRRCFRRFSRAIFHLTVWHNCDAASGLQPVQFPSSLGPGACLRASVSVLPQHMQSRRLRSISLSSFVLAVVKQK